MGDHATGNTTDPASTESSFKAAKKNGMMVMRIIMYNLDDAKLADPAQRLTLGQTLPSPGAMVNVHAGKSTKLTLPSVQYAYTYSVYRRMADEPERRGRLIGRVNARVGEDAVFVDHGKAAGEEADRVFQTLPDGVGKF